jgi:hypothetical protein
MKIFRILNSAILAALVAGCHRETNPDQPGGPKVAGGIISFPVDAPQLGGFVMEPARERKAAAIGWSGRLARDDDGGGFPVTNAVSSLRSPLAGVEIPSQAIFLKDHQPCAFVEIGLGQFQRRAVKLGVESNGRTAVLDGIMPGERVVSEGSLRLESIVEGAGS